jgi:co-chaperonin GroES (HSP10)
MIPSRAQSHARRPKKGQRFKKLSDVRGARITDENITFIPKEMKLRPLRDQIIVEPVDIMHSRVLIIPPHESKLVRGKVIAVGPGHYPNYYLDKDGKRLADHERNKRAKVASGTVFVPTTVRVGDMVHLDGRNTGKDAFDAFYYGDQYCVHAREADVAGVECSSK